MDGNTNKCCVSLPDETLVQMDYLRERMRLNPSIKRSQLLQQIIYELYMRMQPDNGAIYNGDVDQYFV